jgi:hypothetical protein
MELEPRPEQPPAVPVTDDQRQGRGGPARRRRRNRPAHATLMGDLAVVVPDGVEVEVTGFDLMGDREVMLAPVPRVPGTPLIRVRAYAVMGDVLVYSDSTVPERKGWRWLGMGHSAPHQKEISE